MSYLFPLGTVTELGSVQVGSNIDVDANSVISISQSVGTRASISVVFRAGAWRII